jgi:hypothetical protein
MAAIPGLGGTGESGGEQICGGGRNDSGEEGNARADFSLPPDESRVCRSRSVWPRDLSNCGLERGPEMPTLLPKIFC